MHELLQLLVDFASPAPVPNPWPQSGPSAKVASLGPRGTSCVEARSLRLRPASHSGPAEHRCAPPHPPSPRRRGLSGRPWAVTQVPIGVLRSMPVACQLGGRQVPHVLYPACRVHPSQAGRPEASCNHSALLLVQRAVPCALWCLRSAWTLRECLSLIPKYDIVLGQPACSPVPLTSSPTGPPQTAASRLQDDRLPVVGASTSHARPGRAMQRSASVARLQPGDSRSLASESPLETNDRPRPIPSSVTHRNRTDHLALARRTTPSPAILSTSALPHNRRRDAGDDAVHCCSRWCGRFPTTA